MGIGVVRRWFHVAAGTLDRVWTVMPCVPRQPTRTMPGPKPMPNPFRPQWGGVTKSPDRQHWSCATIRFLPQNHMLDPFRMATVLITGTSGFIGRALATHLHPRHQVLCLSRKATPVDGVTAFTGDFANPDDLARLDGCDVDVLVHLAAVTGGCSEEDGIRVNVQGTHGLLRYLVDRGCRKFVLASSIALVGMQSIHFRPLQLPVSDEHPCLDRDGYGLSKYLMEEVTRYFGRQNPDLDIVNIRLASIMPDDARPELFSVADPLREWAFGALSRMYLSDAVECFSLAVERPYRPGVQVMNAVAATACTSDPVPDLLKAWYGPDADRIDMSHYQRPGHERDAVYSIQRVADELGFVPRRTTI